MRSEDVCEYRGGRDLVFRQNNLIELAKDLFESTFAIDF